MSVPRKKPRLPRVAVVKRSASPLSALCAGEDQNSSLWVVSYADLVTVLLCFFVIFFSLGKDGRESVIHRILLGQGRAESVGKEISGEAGAEARLSQGTPQPGESAPHVALRVPQTLLKGLNLTTVQDGEKLVLLFPDDIYARAATDLPANARAMLRDLLTRLSPYRDEIDLIFIGHTDPTPLAHIQGRWIADNFDLSSIRAKRALEAAEAFGFPSARLRTEGDGEFKRASRTLSISIQAREGTGR